MEHWESAPWAQWTGFGDGQRRLYVQLDAGCADGTPLFYAAAAALVGARVRPDVNRRMLVVDPAGSQPAFATAMRALGQDVGVLAATKRVVYVDADRPAETASLVDAAVAEADCAVIDNVHLFANIGNMSLPHVLATLTTWLSALHVVVVRVKLDAAHGLVLGRWLAHRATTLFVVRPPSSTGFSTREISGELFWLPRNALPAGFNFRLAESGTVVCAKPEVPENWHCGLLA